MGEAVMSCEGDETLREVEVEMAVDEVDVCDGTMMTSEMFSPRVALRVLLVEADDSTRHVISALLRKCSYKVAAVSDGLKAWEVLKGRPNSVDLILTEVELPSISGFALLTLIMEHDSCKNIPVIMMSSNDSVNMVYKCMLRGAADFLVKPVRKNELQNLWQHVWRRQSQKAEGLSDNDLLINLSNGACTPENEECNEKGNDAQSSCSAQDLEAESAYPESLQGSSKLKFNKVVVACDTESEEEKQVRDNSTALKPAHVVIGSSLEAPEDAVVMIQQSELDGRTLGEDFNTAAEASDNNDALINGSREAIDLIGNFQNRSTKSYIKSSVITATTKFDSCPQLDLSLKRRHDQSTSHQDTAVEERRQAVHQSNVSAFSRYIAIQPSHHAQANTCHEPKEYETGSAKLVSSPIQPSTLEQSSTLDISTSLQNTQKSSEYQAASELRQSEISFYCPQARMLPLTVPVKSVRLDRSCPSNGSSLHPSYYQTGASPTQSPDSAGLREVVSRVMQGPDTNASSCNNQTMLRQEMKFNTMEQMRTGSSANGRSQNSSLCGTLTRLNSSGGGGSACGSNGSGNQATESKADGVSTQEENINRSLQREAALNKFRQKRKDRCFEKKVRYESRKKLAEQRPRVKGQFVRQVPMELSPAIIDTQ
ncbi:unnamed protein product [Rhodiola kirilowii]